MEPIEILQSTGMILNMIGVVLLAIFAVPSHDLNKDGTEGMNLNPDEGNRQKRVKRYWIYFSLTLFAYLLLLLGFGFQLYSLFL